MKQPLLFAAALLLASAVLVGCSATPAPAQGSGPAIITHREGAPLIDTLNSGLPGVTWQLGGTSVSEADQSAARDAAEGAVKQNAASLQKVDYPSLSLPAFVTSTQGMTLETRHFESGVSHIEGSGTDKGGEQYLLLLWQGPELPQHPDRPLVHRWIRAYAVVRLDVPGREVVLLVPTVGGEVQE